LREGSIRKRKVKSNSILNLEGSGASLRNYKISTEGTRTRKMSFNLSRRDSVERMTNSKVRSDSWMRRRRD